MQLETGNIVKFLETAYSYEGLVALLAHAEDGKLAYSSCTCFMTSCVAPHALMKSGEYCKDANAHMWAARELPFADAAEIEYLYLGMPEDGINPHSDSLGRERIIPLIKAEILRRDMLAAQSSTPLLDAPQEAEVA